ncbi:MAG: hypothetical protein C0603_07970 [Denitrovibrio sp.]|nr:MAG: hypothetical protein C0603_07970 [Denitrovibrio sp.]
MYTEKEHDKIRDNFFDLLNATGKIGETFLKHYELTYEDGAFDAKTKRIMAMVGALAAGCDGCIIGQAKRAIDLGATKEEIIEACMIAASIGGTMATSKAAGVVQLLKDKGMF